MSYFVWQDIPLLVLSVCKNHLENQVVEASLAARVGEWVDVEQVFLKVPTKG